MKKKELLHKFKVIVVCCSITYLVPGGMELHSQEERIESEQIRIAYTEKRHVVKKVTAEPEPTEKPECTEVPEKKHISQDAKFNEEDSYLLAKIAMAEAEGEDVEGKALVINVVLNRVESSSFPDSIKKVIFQKKQFSPITDGRFYEVEPNEECLEALKMVKEGWDKSQGALYFESKGSSEWHRNNLKFVFQHGKHYFYTEE